MTPQEMAYYSHAFTWIIENAKAEQPFPWSYYNIEGTLTPLQTFRNGTGGSCREFKEVLKVHQIQQTLNGYACQRRDGSWCKLPRTASPTCNVKNLGSFDRQIMKLKNLF